MVNPPVGLCLFGFPAIKHRGERPPLIFVGSFVNDRLHGAVAFEHRSRPGVQQGEAEAVELDRAEMAALDPAHLEAAAVALGRALLELAGAAVIAIAAAERNRLEAP